MVFDMGLGNIPARPSLLLLRLINYKAKEGGKGGIIRPYTWEKDTYHDETSLKSVTYATEIREEKREEKGIR